MQFISTLINSHPRTLEQKIMSLIQDSYNLNHILQIHALILKSSLNTNNFINGKFLRKILSYSTSSRTALSYAQRLFDEIPHPDTFIYNTMIRAFLNSQDYAECLSFFLRLRSRDGVLVDSFSLSLVGQACGRLKDVKGGLSLHTLVVKLGFGDDLFVQTGLIEMYAKFGLIDFARKVFDKMRNPDLVSYNVLLAEYVRVGDMGSARELFDNIPERDLISWNTMIHGYSSLGNVGAGSVLFDKCLDKDLVSWSSMIAGHAKSRQSHEALMLFHEMQLANVLPDKVTMVSVLSACGDLGALAMGTMTHEYIERDGIDIDMKLATCLVDMYAKCGDIDNALRVFNKTVKKDVLLWSAMIMGLANHGFGEIALDHFSKMVSEGIKPNGVTFIGVLSACSHTGMVNKGRAYFNSMSDDYDITPKIEHYGCMVDILGRAGHLHEARELIRKMPFEPDAVVWRALLAACRIFKNVKLAEEATMKLLSMEAHADGNYVLLSNIYSQAKKWDKVVKIRRMMKQANVQKVPGSSSIEIDNAVHEFIAGDKSHPRSKEIYEMLSEVICRLKCEGYNPLITSVLQDIDDKEKEAILAQHSEKLAIAYGLLSTTPGSTILIVKNLRVCEDCHIAIKLISRLYERKIIVRDRNRFHHFANGSCSCKDFW